VDLFSIVEFKRLEYQLTLYSREGAIVGDFNPDEFDLGSAWNM
jgi:hypothetical protein